MVSPAQRDEVPAGLHRYADGRIGCWWAGDDEPYQHYHDTEWGRPTTDDRRLFEKVCLEGFQAGLSWLTILRKREAFRMAFADFDAEVVAAYSERDVLRLLDNAGIIRHRGKIEATINNAQRLPDIVEEFGSFSSYLWGFQPEPDQRPAVIDYATMSEIAVTPESTALSKDLKKRGWKFVGPTTMYAMMQAMGLVNDHLEGCWVRAELEA